MNCHVLYYRYFSFVCGPCSLVHRMRFFFYSHPMHYSGKIRNKRLLYIPQLCWTLCWLLLNTSVLAKHFSNNRPFLLKFKKSKHYTCLYLHNRTRGTLCSVDSVHLLKRVIFQKHVNISLFHVATLPGGR